MIHCELKQQRRNNKDEIRRYMKKRVNFKMQMQEKG